jgi:pimeloyl-ACP methyl ester carboxylesterase
VTIPALYMAGDRDFVAAVNSQSIAKQSAMVAKRRPAIMLVGCGHWTEQERAPEVSAAMIDFHRSLWARTRTQTSGNDRVVAVLGVTGFSVR